LQAIPLDLSNPQDTTSANTAWSIFYVGMVNWVLPGSACSVGGTGAVSVSAAPSVGYPLASLNTTGWALGYAGAYKDVFPTGSSAGRGAAAAGPAAAVADPVMVGSPVPLTDAWTLYGAVRDPASGVASFYRFGAALAAGWAGPVGGPRGLQLGGQGDVRAGDPLTDVSVAEVVVFQRAVTTAERQASYW
jgi:hypothetical protein